MSTIFTLRLLLHQKFSFNRQLVGGETHCFAGDLFAHPLHFKQDGTGANLGHKEFGIAFAAAHFNILWFFGDWCVWENTDPDFATAFDIAGHSLTGGFDLAAGDAFVILALQSKLAKRDVVATRGDAADFALSYLAEFGSVRD